MRGWVRLAIVLLALIGAAGCSGVVPPPPSRLAVLFDGVELHADGGVPRPGETLLVIRNGFDEPIAPALLRLPSGADLDLIAESGADAEAVLTGGTLAGQHMVPGRLAPRLVQDSSRHHIHLAPGLYVLVVDHRRALGDTAWLAFAVGEANGGDR